MFLEILVERRDRRCRFAVDAVRCLIRRGFVGALGGVCCCCRRDSRPQVEYGCHAVARTVAGYELHCRSSLARRQE